MLSVNVAVEFVAHNEDPAVPADLYTITFDSDADSSQGIRADLASVVQHLAGLVDNFVVIIDELFTRVKRIDQLRDRTVVLCGFPPDHVSFSVLAAGDKIIEFSSVQYRWCCSREFDWAGFLMSVDFVECYVYGLRPDALLPLLEFFDTHIHRGLDELPIASLPVASFSVMLSVDHSQLVSYTRSKEIADTVAQIKE